MLNQFQPIPPLTVPAPWQFPRWRYSFTPEPQRIDPINVALSNIFKGTRRK